MFRNVDASRSIPRNFCPAKHLFLLAFRRKNSEKRRTAMRISRSVRGIRISDVEKTVNAARQTELTVRARALDQHSRMGVILRRSRTHGRISVDQRKLRKHQPGNFIIPLVRAFSRFQPTFLLNVRVNLRIHVQMEDTQCSHTHT